MYVSEFKLRSYLSQFRVGYMLVVNEHASQQDSSYTWILIDEPFINV